MNIDYTRFTSKPWLRKGLALALAAVLGLSACNGAVRADNLDQELTRHARKVIMKDLLDHKYQNVGILKFTLEKANGKSTYNAGLINVNMANRLENALILADDHETPPIGITRGAGKVAALAAAKKLAGDPTTAEGRKTLFELTYPLAWGPDAKVDAFLAGVVKVSADMKTTTLIVQAFDKDDFKTLRVVATIEVPTDRNILSDMGKSFLVRAIGEVKNDDRLNNDAVNDVANQNKNTPEPPTITNNKTRLSEILDFKVFYDVQQAEFSGDPDSPGEVKLSAPKENQVVHFTLANKSKERLAVVVRVNGQNTSVIEEDNLQPCDCSKWVVEPGKEYVVEGFYGKGGGVSKFKVLSDEAAKQVTLNPETRGLIQVDVFAEGKKDDSGLGSPQYLSLRTSSRSANGEAVARPKTFDEAFNQVVASSKKGPSDRFIVPGDSGEAVIRMTTFENPTQIGSLVLRYRAAD